MCMPRVEWPSERKNKLITKEKLFYPIFQTILRKYKLKNNKIDKREVTHSALSIVVYNTETEVDLMGVYWTLLPYNNGRKHILFKCTWSTLQGKPYFKP